MKKLTLAERIKLSNEVYQDHAKHMLIEADALLPEEPIDPDVQHAIDTYARWIEEDRFAEFKKDVRFAVGLVGAIIFCGCLYYILYVLNGGLL